MSHTCWVGLKVIAYHLHRLHPHQTIQSKSKPFYPVDKGEVIQERTTPNKIEMFHPRIKVSSPKNYWLTLTLSLMTSEPKLLICYCFLHNMLFWLQIPVLFTGCFLSFPFWAKNDFVNETFYTIIKNFHSNSMRPYLFLCINSVHSRSFGIQHHSFHRFYYSHMLNAFVQIQAFCDCLHCSSAIIWAD